MKKSYLTLTLLMGLIFSVVIPSFLYADEDGDTLTYRLEGLELFKGIDITDTYRKCTLFAGEIFYEQYKIGTWTAVLSHKGTENIEVCGGKGDIVTVRLTIRFSGGHRLVLGMRDDSGTQDVFWDFDYAGPRCYLGGFNCEGCGEAEVADCQESGSSNLAMIDDLELEPMWGSTVNIDTAVLQGGRLCHYYPVIPRVFALLNVAYKFK